MDKKQAIQIMHDYQVLGLSCRTLGKKYGMSHTRIYRMIKKNQKKQSGPEEALPEEAMPDDVKGLKEALRKERLKTELLNTVIDIASKELGVDIRKKSGTRQS
jgi:transposase